MFFPISKGNLEDFLKQIRSDSSDTQAKELLENLECLLTNTKRELLETVKLVAFRDILKIFHSYDDIVNRLIIANHRAIVMLYSVEKKAHQQMGMSIKAIYSAVGATSHVITVLTTETTKLNRKIIQHLARLSKSKSTNPQTSLSALLPLLTYQQLILTFTNLGKSALIAIYKLLK